MIATLVGEMPFTGVSAAAASPDGKELLVKTYTNVYYWKRNAGETIGAALLRTPLALGYMLEPQGEAICFKNNNKPELVEAMFNQHAGSTQIVVASRYEASPVFCIEGISVTTAAKPKRRMIIKDERQLSLF